MKTSIDRAGRVLIPKKVRDQASLKPGTPLDARCEGGAVVLEPRPMDVRIKKRGRFFVAEPVGSVAELSSAAVARETGAVRGGRRGRG